MTALRVDDHPHLPVPLLTLDERELSLVHLMAEGLALATVARRLDVSERTLRRRIRKLCERLEVDSPVQVVVMAAKAGLV
jgi:DNA-binding NarL/FixJ family response regulator